MAFSGVSSGQLVREDLTKKVTTDQVLKQGPGSPGGWPGGLEKGILGRSRHTACMGGSTVFGGISHMVLSCCGIRCGEREASLERLVGAGSQEVFHAKKFGFYSCRTWGGLQWP